MVEVFPKLKAVVGEGSPTEATIFAFGNADEWRGIVKFKDERFNRPYDDFSMGWKTEHYSASGQVAMNCARELWQDLCRLIALNSSGYDFTPETCPGHDWESIWDDGDRDCRVCMYCGKEQIFEHEK